MSQPKVFVTRLIPDAGLEMIQESCHIVVWPDELPPPRANLMEKVKGIDALLSLLTDRIDAEVMAAAGLQLKVISNYAVGYDNIDIPEATRRGIPVGNTPGILTDATADFAFALLMAAARRIVEGDKLVRGGRWKTWGPKVLLGPDIHGATLGIIGFGRIGQAMAKRAGGFSMRCLFYDPIITQEMHGAKSVSLETIYAEADFISLHTPLSSETRHLIDRSVFSKMKPTAVLINTARGPIVDPDALYGALKAKQIAYAALDVTEPEPIPVDSPLLALDNIIIAPHIASASYASRAKMATMAAGNLLAGLRGDRLPNCVNPEVYNR